MNYLSPDERISYYDEEQFKYNYLFKVEVSNYSLEQKLELIISQLPITLVCQQELEEKVVTTVRLINNELYCYDSNDYELGLFNHYSSGELELESKSAFLSKNNYWLPVNKKKVYNYELNELLTLEEVNIQNDELKEKNKFYDYLLESEISNEDLDIIELFIYKDYHEIMHHFNNNKSSYKYWSKKYKKLLDDYENSKN